MNIKLSLIPCDTFFFRDGKPFSQGEQTEAFTLFPPFPSTIYGALRTAYISECGWHAFKNGDLENEIGTINEYGNLQIKGIFLEKDTDVFFVLPGDIVVEKDWLKSNGDAGMIHYLSPAEQSKAVSNRLLSKILTYHGSCDVVLDYPSGAFLDKNNLKKYLLGKPIGYIPLKNESDFLEIEPKTGIARDLNTLRTREGYLYRIDMMRFIEGYQLLADIEEADDKFLNKIMKIGGENKPFFCRQSNIEKILQLTPEDEAFVIDSIKKTGLFKLYFLTPAIWQNGWHASWMNFFNNQNQQEFDYKGKKIKLSLVAAQIGKYQNVGGWDIAKNMPKTMYRAVPAGSVYYLSLHDKEDAEFVFKAFHYQNICDLSNQVEKEKKMKEGFGLTLVGVSKEMEE